MEIITSPTPERQPKTKFCWLVELFAQCGNSLGNYHADPTDQYSKSRMVTNANDANKYPTKEGAEMVAEALNAHMQTNVWRAVEHGFDA